MNVHIVGPAGSGKTTLAKWIAQTTGATAYDLDWIVYDRDGERPPGEVSARIAGIAGSRDWATEGAYREAWLHPLLNAADQIVWLDFPLPVCLWRIFRRHVVAEIQRNNEHRGWRKLLRFLNYTRSIAGRSRSETAALLDAYGNKVVRCRSSRDVMRFRATLSGRSGPSAAPPRG